MPLRIKNRPMFRRNQFYFLKLKELCETQSLFLENFNILSVITKMVKFSFRFTEDRRHFATWSLISGPFRDCIKVMSHILCKHMCHKSITVSKQLEWEEPIKHRIKIVYLTMWIITIIWIVAVLNNVEGGNSDFSKFTSRLLAC